MRLWQWFWFDGCRSLYGLCCPGKWLWVDSNGKNGKWTSCRGPIWSWVFINLHPQEVIRAWSRKLLKILAKNLPFLKKKMIPYREIFKMLFQKNSPPLRSTSCVQILWNLADGKSVKSRVAYLTNKSASLSHSLLCRSCPKSARASGKQCTQEFFKFHPNRFTSGGAIVKHVNTIQTCDKSVSNILPKPSFKPNNELPKNNHTHTLLNSAYRVFK